MLWMLRLMSNIRAVCTNIWRRSLLNLTKMTSFFMIRVHITFMSNLGLYTWRWVRAEQFWDCGFGISRYRFSPYFLSLFQILGLWHKLLLVPNILRAVRTRECTELLRCIGWRFTHVCNSNAGQQCADLLEILIANDTDTITEYFRQL